MDVAAVRTTFTGRVPEAGIQNLPAVPVGFVLGQGDQPRNGGVSQHSGNLAIAQHASDMQLFEANDVRSPHQVRGELLQEVVAGMSNPGMDIGQLDPGSTVPVDGFPSRILAGEFLS